MKECEPYLNHQFRIFEHYFGKFDDTFALCDCPDKEIADRLIKVLEFYYEDRPFAFFKKEITKNVNFRR